MTDRDPLREALKEDFATLREERDSWRRQAAALADALREYDDIWDDFLLGVPPTILANRIARVRAALDRQEEV